MDTGALSKEARRRPWVRFGALLAMVGLSIAGQASGANLVVNTLLDQNNGTVGGLSLRDAIALADADDTITFDASVVPGFFTLTLGALTIDGDVRINGPGVNHLTISANSASRVFDIAPGADANLFGMTLVNGYSGTAPGGCINNRGTLKLVSCRIENSESTTLGGGVYNDGGTLILETTTVTSNEAVDGGGLYNVSGRTTLRRSLVSGNTALQDGAGLYANGGDTFVINTTFSGNQVTGSNGDGGGLFTNGANVVLVNATIFGNSTGAGGRGGGAFSLSGMTVRNTIIAGNTTSGAGPDVHGAFTSEGHNFIGLEIGATGFDFMDTDLNYTTAGVVGVSEVLEVTLLDNGGPTRTHALVPESPAIDAGRNLNAIDPSTFAVLNYDQRDEEYPRIENGTVDIGAFELTFLDEGEASALAMDLLEMFNAVDTSGNHLLSVFEVIAYLPSLTETEFNQLDANGDASLTPGELLAVAGPGIVHNADTDASGTLSLRELLRVVQLFNAGGYRCAESAGDTEDGFEPGAVGAVRSLDTGCFRHAGDYNPTDGAISLSELLRLVQFFQTQQYTWCPGEGSEDGFCAQ